VLLVVIVLEISQECGVIPCDARCYVTMSEIENWFSATRQKSKEREREREREREKERERERKRSRTGTLWKKLMATTRLVMAMPSG